MIENKLHIFDFDDPVRYLQEIFTLSAKKNKRFSIRSFAKQLNLSSPALLAQVLSEKRPLTPRFGLKIAEKLKLSHFEMEFFEMLLLSSNARTPREERVYKEIIRDYRLKISSDSKSTSSPMVQPNT